IGASVAKAKPIVEVGENHRRVMGESPGITCELRGAPPVSAGPRNIIQAYGIWAESSFPVFGPVWRVGERRLALTGGRNAVRPAILQAFFAGLMQPCRFGPFP